MVQFDVDVDDNSEEQDKETKAKTAQENMLRTLCYVVEQRCPKQLSLFGSGSGSSGDFYSAPPMLKQRCQQQHKDK